MMGHHAPERPGTSESRNHAERYSHTALFVFHEKAGQCQLRFHIAVSFSTRCARLRSWVCIEPPASFLQRHRLLSPYLPSHS